MQTVICPNHECGKSCQVGDESLGGRARCKACGSVFELTEGIDQSDAANCSADVASSKSTGSTHSEAAQLHETKADGLKALTQSEIPETLGRFKIKSVLGAGTFGTVYRAYDPQLDREVALKVPNVGVLRTEEEAERFLREARAAASLRHPNICPVYEANEQDGRYCIVMAFISGKTLTSLITPDKPLGERQAALLVHKLAQALDLAHQKGVIHRDLKPGNIMFDQEHREPVIMDFGLARRADSSDAQVTQMGQILGTPAYMSPEQAQGQTESIGPASDVYSVGVIFYELLCCARPFPGTAEQVRAAHYLKTAAEPPSTHRSGIDPTLETICMKAMSREIADRSSMAEFADALMQYLRGAQQATDDLPLAQTSQGRSAATATEPEGEGLSALFAAVAADDKKPTAPKPKKGKRREQPASRKNYWQSLPPAGRWSVGAGTAALLILLGVILFIQTDEGMVKIEILDPSLTVTVADDVITVDNDGKQLNLKVGKHELLVEYEGLEVPFEHSFEIKKAQMVALRVTRVDGTITVLREGQKLPGEPRTTDPTNTSNTKNTPVPTAPSKGPQFPKTTVAKSNTISATPSPKQPLAGGDDAKEWISLFDGSNTSHWQQLGAFRVKDGELVATEGELAKSRDEYGDFELEFDWRVSPGGNGGVYYRERATGLSSRQWKGIEYQLLDNAGHPNGNNPRTSAGSLYSLFAPEVDATRSPGEFNTSRIICRREYVEHWMNDKKLLEYNLDEEPFRSQKLIIGRRKGYIYLQADIGEIAFRKIRIRDLENSATSTVPISDDPDRLAAELILRLGGGLSTDRGPVETIGQLPQGPFKITSISLADNTRVTDLHLASFERLKKRHCDFSLSL